MRIASKDLDDLASVMRAGHNISANKAKADVRKHAQPANREVEERAARR